MLVAHGNLLSFRASNERFRSSAASLRRVLECAQRIESKKVDLDYDFSCCAFDDLDFWLPPMRMSARFALMTDTTEECCRLMHAAAAALDFEEAGPLHDQIILCSAVRASSRQRARTPLGCNASNRALRVWEQADRVRLAGAGQAGSDDAADLHEAQRPMSVDTARLLILDLLADRTAGQTICPSEIARLMTASIGHNEDGDWRSAMPIVHDAVDRLAHEGTIRLSWKGKALPFRKGPYRITR